MNTSILGRLTMLFMIVAASCLSVYHIDYKQYDRPISQAVNSNIVLSRFDFSLTSDDKVIREMEAQSEELNTILEFMVWPMERRKVLDQAIKLTRQQINHQPTKSEYWKRLLYLQYEVEAEPKQLSWILDKIYRLDGWNNKTMITLFRYCVPFSFSEMLSVPQSCEKIVKHLSRSEKRPALARQIGISQEDLNVVLNRYQKVR